MMFPLFCFVVGSFGSHSLQFQLSKQLHNRSAARLSVVVVLYEASSPAVAENLQLLNQTVEFYMKKSGL